MAQHPYLGKEAKATKSVPLSLFLLLCGPRLKANEASFQGRRALP